MCKKVSKTKLISSDGGFQEHLCILPYIYALLYMREIRAVLRSERIETRLFVFSNDSIEYKWSKRRLGKQVTKSRMPSIFSPNFS